MVNVPESITIDGVNHPVSKFSESVQRLVHLRTAWVNEMDAERRALAKTEAAIRGLDAELASLVTKELTDEKNEVEEKEDAVE